MYLPDKTFNKLDKECVNITKRLYTDKPTVKNMLNMKIDFTVRSNKKKDDHFSYFVCYCAGFLPKTVGETKNDIHVSEAETVSALSDANQTILELLQKL